MSPALRAHPLAPGANTFMLPREHSRSVRLAGLVLVAMLLAGCASAPTRLTSASTAPTLPVAAPATLNATTASADAPTWARGDAWLVENKEGSNSTNAALVVTSADSNGYTLETTDPAIAQYDAMFDVSYVGKIRASDLAGSQQGRTVAFFSFPLVDGKAWKATWDGGEVNLSASFRAAIPTPLGPEPGFDIMGEKDGKTYVTYDYVPALRWWSHLDFSGYGMRVTGVQHNWTGQLAEAKAKLLLTLTTVAPVASTPAGTFTVDAGQTFVVVSIARQATQFIGGCFLVVDPSGATYPASGPDYGYSTGASVKTLQYAFPASQGDWRLVAPSVFDPAGGKLLQVREVQSVTRAFA